jgi:phosphatidylglycerophosphatase A
MSLEKSNLKFSDRLYLLFGTWFGSGLLPKAPGTWGTLAALPLIVALHYFLPPYFYAAAAVALMLLSIRVADGALNVYQEHSEIAAINPHRAPVFNSDLLQGMIKGEKGQIKDPGMIVIDEVAGMAVTMLFVPFSLLGYFVAFFAFRFFDIIKLYPTRKIESVGGGAGIVLDDVAAGVYACIATHLSLFIYHFTGLPLF